MSESAPVPPLPPPPPPLLATSSSFRTALEKDKVHATRSINDECSWALNYLELQKGCFLSRVCQYAQPKRCQYTAIDSILQIGPTCGLTALSMLLNGQPTAAELLVDARSQKYTINGEMFSTQYLYELVQKHVRSPLKCHFHEGLLDCDQIKEQLCAGACLLVPYDADVNHAPCQRSGHRAHWALIVGYLIDDHDKFYVVARHGKTRNLAIWSLAALSESNANLVEFAQPKGHEDLTFLLPPGGIDGNLGLRERSIVVTNLPYQVVQVC